MMARQSFTFCDRKIILFSIPILIYTYLQMPEVRVTPEVCQYKQRPEDMRYVDELINKQANE